MKDKHKELELINKKIKLNYNKHLSGLYEKQKRLQEDIDNQTSKELIGKTFVYRNNSYSCPKKKSDYWDVYLKVIKAKDEGIIVVTCEKDSNKDIMIKTETRWNNHLPGYTPCPKIEFDDNYKKLMKEITDDVIFCCLMGHRMKK